MKYPNVKPQQGEQQDVNQRRYPPDNIDLAGPPDRPEQKQDTYDEPGENAAINDSRLKGNPPAAK